MTMTMTIDGILRLTSPVIIAVTAESPVAEAARLIARHRIGAVVVQDRGGNTIGLLSEADIVRIVAERRAGIRGLAAEDAMRRAPVWITPDASLRDAIALMAERDLRHLPVCAADGRLLGLVGLAELLRHAEAAPPHPAAAEGQDNSRAYVN
jgi:CBS domain-containing protein